MSEKIYLSKRKWLNPKGSCDSGAIHYSVQSEYNYVDSSLYIWDCSRKVGLAFGFSNERSAKIRLRKVNMIIEALEEMKEAMGKAYPDLFDKKNTDEEET